MQAEADWGTQSASTSDTQRTVTLTFLSDQHLTKTVQEIGNMPFMEFATLYEVSFLANVMGDGCHSMPPSWYYLLVACLLCLHLQQAVTALCTACTQIPLVFAAILYGYLAL